jgi:uncharacterized protein
MSVEQELASRLEAQPNVCFALLFGSRSSGTAREASDWDLGVYLMENTTAEQRFRWRMRMSTELEEIAPVDLVVLNDADPLLAQRALAGRVLAMRDRRTYVRYFVRTMAAAEDQRYFDRILAHGRQKRLEKGTFGRP